MKKKACRFVGLFFNACAVLLSLLLLGQENAAAQTFSFTVASGEWHHLQNSNIPITNVSGTSIGWFDGVQKTASLTYTTGTGGTVSGDYNGTFNFVVKSGIAWKIEFGNGSSWAADSGEPFTIAAGGWHHTSDPGIAIVTVDMFSIAWNDGALKGASLTYSGTSTTSGTTSGDYSGSFSYIVTNGVAWRIEFGNGSSWEADSGQPRSFTIASGGWHHTSNPSIDITNVSLYSIGWNDGQNKSGTLTYTDSASTDGTVSGDYNGAFGFEVTNGIAWKILFGNGSSWEADSGEPAP